MKLLVDCNDVFDRLTRGPFPTGHDDDARDDDAAVESHLHVCHECRRLAEALRPAVNLLHEAYPHIDDELPAYLALPLSPPHPLSPSPLPSPSTWSVGWQLVAAALFGVVVSALAIGNWSREGRSAAGTQRMEMTGSPGLAQLASLNLREVCLPTSTALAAGTERLRCCTDCHSSSVPQGIDVSRLQLACIACHEPTGHASRVP